MKRNEELNISNLKILNRNDLSTNLQSLLLYLMWLISNDIKVNDILKEMIILRLQLSKMLGMIKNSKKEDAYNNAEFTIYSNVDDYIFKITYGFTIYSTDKDTIDKYFKLCYTTCRYLHNMQTQYFLVDEKKDKLRFVGLEKDSNDKVVKILSTLKPTMTKSIINDSINISELFKYQKYFVRLQRLYIDNNQGNSMRIIENPKYSNDFIDQKNVFDFLNNQDI